MNVWGSGEQQSAQKFCRAFARLAAPSPALEHASQSVPSVRTDYARSSATYSWYGTAKQAKEALAKYMDDKRRCYT